jgi:transposase
VAGARRAAWETGSYIQVSDTRKGENIDEFIEGFSGYLQTDGYAGYDRAVSGRTDITHVGCFAHGRRKFFEAQKTGVHTKSAAIGIKYIKGLYEIDKELRERLTGNGLDEQGFLTPRKERSAVIKKDLAICLTTV